MGGAVARKGDHCQVYKHSGMGCCVVSLESHTARETLMRFAMSTFHVTEGKSGPLVETKLGDVSVQFQRHRDKQFKRETVTDIYVAWGHEQEKRTPFAVNQICEHFDALFQRAAWASFWHENAQNANHVM